MNCRARNETGSRLEIVPDLPQLHKSSEHDECRATQFLDDLGDDLGLGVTIDFLTVPLVYPSGFRKTFLLDFIIFP